MSGLRQVASFYDPEEAQIAAGYLRANDIAVVLADDISLNVMPHLRVALGGYRVLVPAFDLQTAKSLLAETESVAEENTPPCHICGGKNYVPLKTWFPKGLILLLLGIFFPFAENTAFLQCSSCGTRITRKEAAERGI